MASSIEHDDIVVGECACEGQQACSAPHQPMKRNEGRLVSARSTILDVDPVNPASACVLS